MCFSGYFMSVRMVFFSNLKIVEDQSHCWWSLYPLWLCTLFSSVAQSRLTLCNTMDRSMPGFLSIANSWSFLKILKIRSIKSVMPSNHLTLYHLLILLSSVLPSIRVFSSVTSSNQVARVLEFQLQHQSFQCTPRIDFLEDGLVGSPCSPGDSQESSSTPQFKHINSLVLNFLYSPNLTSIHDYWKNHSLDQTDLCW